MGNINSFEQPCSKPRISAEARANLKTKHRPYRWLTGAAAGFAAFAGGREVLYSATPAPLTEGVQQRFSLGEFAFHHEGVLGTSLELFVQAGALENARECECQVLAEIERLRRILSTRDSLSEMSRVQGGAPVESRELAQLLGVYQFWAAHTGGAIHLNMAGVTRQWEEAQAAQRPPDDAALAEAFKAPRAFNVDALGKGFIVDRAVAVARRFAFSGLLNIGGDLRAWGGSAWPVGVADPRNPAENAPFAGQFMLRDAAVATSGGYARYYTIAGKRYSHVIDPRTLRAIDCLASATVVAADCLTANALATAACVLGKLDGEKLARSFNAAGYLLADAIQPDVRGGLLKIAASAPETKPSPHKVAQSDAWPKDFQVAINLEIKAPTGGRAKRPYVAVWIQDLSGKLVRTVSIWGTKDKYISELSYWWEAAGGDQAYTRFKSISRATRPAGKYTLVWDGRDEQGNAVPKATYTVCVELNREEGHHTQGSADISCREEQKWADLEATAESEASTVAYGPKAQ
jgi:thiamine biosynthesis lipoprotein ApbE